MTYPNVNQILSIFEERKSTTNDYDSLIYDIINEWDFPGDSVWSSPDNECSYDYRDELRDKVLSELGLLV